MTMTPPPMFDPDLSPELHPGVNYIHAGDRTYIQAPLQFLLVGIVNGVLYPKSEIAKCVADWQNRPLVACHEGGEPIGVVASPIFTGTMIRATGLFDVLATRQIAPQILRQLLLGQPLSLSEGMYVTKKVPYKVFQYRGRGYQYIATAIIPHHLCVMDAGSGLPAVPLQLGQGVNLPLRP